MKDTIVKWLPTIINIAIGSLLFFLFFEPKVPKHSFSEELFALLDVLPQFLEFCLFFWGLVFAVPFALEFLFISIRGSTNEVTSFSSKMAFWSSVIISILLYGSFALGYYSINI